MPLYLYHSARNIQRADMQALALYSHFTAIRYQDNGLLVKAFHIPYATDRKPLTRTQRERVCLPLCTDLFCHSYPPHFLYNVCGGGPVYALFDDLVEIGCALLADSFLHAKHAHL